VTEGFRASRTRITPIVPISIFLLTSPAVLRILASPSSLDPNLSGEWSMTVRQRREF
jgi:hypothetical protein